MRKLPRPDDVPREVFVLCASTRHEPLRARLLAATDDVVAAAAAYEDVATRAVLHELPEHAIVGVDVTAVEMGRLYDDKIVRSGAPGRYIYDRLMLSPKHGVCPL